ncbi:MAG TPA: ABC transporter permease subunit [Pseudonocardia sp.]|nr:ABC transporter permease subunit [Pseudonocardia sp.]
MTVPADRATRDTTRDTAAPAAAPGAPAPDAPVQATSCPGDRAPSVAAGLTGRRSAPLPRLLRSELRFGLAGPRTLITLAVLSLIPLLIGIGVTARGPAGDALAAAPGPGPGLIAAITGNGLMLPISALRVTLFLLMPLGVSIAAADALAGEAAHGSLRGLLLAPIGRGRLVAVKAFGVLAVAVLEVAVVTVLGLVAGLTFVGGGGQLLTLSGTSVGFGDAMARIGVAAGWALLQVAAVGAVALAVSALTEHPLVVPATVLGAAIVFGVLNVIPSLGWLRPVLLTSGWSSVTDLLRDPVPTDGLTHSALLAAAYLVLGLAVAVAGTLRREA